MKTTLTSTKIKRVRERGVALFVGTCALVFVIPLVGMAVDVGYLYACKTRLQSAVDGAALAAARALVLGLTTQAQSDSAKQNAVNWFYANFPTSNWGTTSTIMNIAGVQVFDDPGNPNLRNVTVTASTNVPTYFMKWFNFNSTLISGTGNASRRDVVAMMVLDRSGSMGASCTPFKAAAKLFTGQFAAGRDRIGMVTFSDNVVVNSVPTTAFQTTLGYTNSFGTGTGLIDSINCSGGTNTAAAMSLGYNAMYNINLPGAMNFMLVETDGLPNMVMVNEWDGTNFGIASTSGCTDRNGKTKAGGGFRTSTAADAPAWQGTFVTPATPTYDSGTPNPWFADIPAGMIFAAGGYDPPLSSKYQRPFKVFSTTPGTMVTTPPSASCLANPGTTVSSMSTDLAWIPQTDVFGNNLASGYQTVTTSGGHITNTSFTQIHNAATNAVVNMAYRARTDPNLPISFFALGFSSAVDHVLLQRVANDPLGDSVTPYPDCASAVNCVTYSNQPPGTYVYADTAANLGTAFLKLSAQILRLSH